MARKQRIVVVGAGPRGVSVLERLAARAAARPELRVRADFVDPFEPGPGHVWRTDQSQLFLMNTPSFFPTVVPSRRTVESRESFPAPLPALAGLTFDAWRERIAADPSSSLVELDREVREELEVLTRSGFPSRKLYGTYLSDVWALLVANLPENLGVRHHRQEAVHVVPAHGAAHRYRVELGDGEWLSADAVVLAVGHTDATLRDDQQDLVEFAAEHRLNYWPPAVPADVHWDDLPAGEEVLVRGMGLNFHDALAQVTEGRGGRFSEDPAHPHRLVYEPSGREPMVWTASRRGTPYRGKAVLDTYYPPSVENRFFTRELVDATRAVAAREVREMDFEAEYWPLIRRDAQWNYYRTLVRTDPGRISGDPQDFLPLVDRVLSDPEHASWWARLDRLTAERVDPTWILKPERLARSFDGESFGSHEEYAAAVVHLLDRDVDSSFAAEDSPLKMAIGSLNQSRMLVKYAVADRGISSESWSRGLERSFGGLVEGLASGPPVLRIQQMAALARAGVLRFLGPDPVLTADPVHGEFTASSPWVRDVPVRSRWLVEALAPANDVRRSTSPLIGRLFSDRLAQPWRMRLPDAPAPVPGQGFEVTRSPYRLVAPSGEAVEGVYALGLQLSSAQWGTAIAAESDGELELSASTIADADDIVADALG